MKDFTVASIFVRMLIEGAEKQGVDCERILLDNGISKLTVDKDEF